ncbi:hypothetical protein PENTCL1PPCAC_19327 [Pristionchus entomophagus]|uniref:Uncharacterized protein n=1 Tax=Pristionchus entomophagus TaxID=358040 RepID=A0AAV5TRT7_9BILA|nr:hypothetical protein PENTCL1PPCAC_19327 [Pristionchus entomophagus]
MAPSAKRKDLTTSLTLIGPLLLFAAVNGALFEISTWFGGLFVLLLIGIYATARRILTARKVNVKTLEVSLLGLLIPIFSIFSFLSNSHFPWARRPFNLLLMTIPAPHLALLWRMRSQLNHPVMVITSSLLMGFHISSTGSKLELGIVPSALNIIVICYALGIKYISLFMLRENINFNILRWVSLSLVAGFAIGSSVCWHFLPGSNVAYGLIAATVALTPLYGYHDFMYYQMQVPFEEWTVETMLLPTCQVGIKFLSVLIIASYGILGMIAGPGPINESNVLWIWINFCVLIFLAHPLYTCAMWRRREEDPYMPEGQPPNKMSIVGICGSVATIALNIAFACYYCMAAHPLFIADPYLLVMVASLYLLLTHFIDISRTFLAPFLSKLLTAVAGFTVYIIIYGVIITKHGSTENLSSGNFTADESVIENFTDSTTGNITGVQHSAEEVNYEPTKRVLVVAVTICLALAIHIIGAMILECHKKKRSLTALTKKVAPSAPEEKHLDSDYDSDEEEVRRAIP